MEDRYLFKANRADNGEWVTGYYTKSIVNGSVFGYIRESIFGTDIKIMLNTLCQYTGLKDKNGKMIWENDVVRVYGDTDYFGNNLYYFYKVVWNKDLCCWWLSDIYTHEDEYLYICLKGIDVIGNIFDNPELLESEE